MFVRLAFALNINVEPEILIVDEALSVGDVFFQAKCYRKMEEIKQRGTTILMVTHDMGSIIKYCDKVVLLNKGEFIAEGEPGHMVDLYKKILANQLDSLNEELESDYSGGMLGDEKKAKAEESHSDGSLMKDKITINTDRTEYGDGRAEIFDLGLFDAKGNLTNLLLKGEMFTNQGGGSASMRRSRVRSLPTRSAIKRETDLTGTNTMYEGCDIKPVGDGDVYGRFLYPEDDITGRRVPALYELYRLRGRGTCGLPPPVQHCKHYGDLQQEYGRRLRHGV